MTKTIGSIIWRLREGGLDLDEYLYGKRRPAGRDVGFGD